MANFYLDVSAIGNEYQAYADTPTTWGVPQDGNGKAKDGGVSAVFEIDCTSSVASGTGTIGVFGVTVSSTLNASGSALATAIVSAINGTATAVVATYSAALLAINKLVYARVKPTDANVVQIMVRIAGADWNSYLPTQANISPAATITLATTGVDGPFAYLRNSASVFGKASVDTYGIHVAKSAGPTDPGALADAIYVRTMRSSANLSLTISSAAGYLYITCPAATHRQFIFDDGTTWTGDDGVFTITFTGGSNTRIRSALGQYILSYAARKQYGLKLAVSMTGNQSLNFGYDNGYYRMTNVFVEELNTTSFFYLVDSANYYGNLSIDSCKFKYRVAHSLFSSYSYGYQYLITNTLIEWTGIGANVAGIINFPSNITGNGPATIQFTNCDFLVDGGSFNVVNPVSNPNNLGSYSHVNIAFLNCTGLSNPSAGWAATAYLSRYTFLWDSPDNDRSFRYETGNYKLDWISDGTYPTYNTQLASGAYMSHRLTWDSARLQPGLALTVGRYGAWFKDTDATKTVTLELLVPTAELPNAAQLAITVKYTGSAGSVYYETTLEPHTYSTAGIATALPDGVGTGAWTMNGVTGVSSKKLTITTNNAVKQNSEITAELIIVGPPASNRVIYVNPDLVLS